MMRFFSIFNKLLFNNPLLKRYKCSLFRGRQLWIYITIYVAVIVLLLYVNYNVNEMRYNFVVYEQLCSTVYYQLLALLVLMLGMWGGYNSISAIRPEVVNKTYDFFRLLPLTALQKGVGIMVGRNLLVLSLSGITLVLVLLFGALGRVSGFLQFQIIAALVSVTFFVNSTALLASNTSVRRQKKTPIVIWVLVFVFLGPILIRLVVLPFAAMSEISKAEHFMVEFYTIKVHILILVSLVCLYFGIWNMLGIIRRFTYEAEPLFSRNSAVFFLLGYELILIGLFWPYLSEFDECVYIFWLVSLVPVLMIPLGSMKSFDNYVEYCGLARGGGDSGKSMGRTLLVHCNPGLAVILFGIWAGFSVAAGLAGDRDVSGFALSIVVIFSFFIFLMLLLELYVVYNPVFSKIGLLLGFVAVMYLLLPIILAFTMEKPLLVLHSLIGYFVHLFNPLKSHTAITVGPVLITNISFCIVPILLITRRYLGILTLRREM